LGDVFDALDAVRPPDRVAISGLLRTPNGRFPITPVEIARLALPRDPGRVAALVTLIDGAMRSQVDGALAGRSFGEIVPDLDRVGGGIDTAAEATNRLAALAYANGAVSWSSLAPLRVADVRRWRGAGADTTARLLGLALRAALRHAGVGTTAGEQGTLFDEHRSALALTLDRVLVSIADPRARAIFEALELRIAPTRTAGTLTMARTSLGEVAGLVGLGYERSRQLRGRARDAVRVAVRHEPSLVAITRQVAAEIGEMALVGSIDEIVQAHGLDSIEDPAAMLLVWLAGPYLEVAEHDGWVSPRPVEVAADTYRLLSEAGGVHDHDALTADLRRAGIALRFVDSWLSAQPVRFDAGVVVHLVGRPLVVAERVLESMGRAASSAELLSALGLPGPPQHGSLVSELRRSPRFVETAPDRWELVDWGGDPSEHMVRIEIVVTEATLAGEPGVLPAGAASLLGVLPGDVLHIPTHFGPLVIVHRESCLEHGSLRPISLACGATIGGVLLFVIDPRRATAVVEVVADALPHDR